MRVFVYGTLKKGYWNHHLLANSKFIGIGKVSGYEIYDLGSYPGIVPGNTTDEVYGEVYEVDNETLIRLDRLEGEGILYVREMVDVELNNEMIKASIYVYNRKIVRARKLEKKWGISV